MGSHFGAGDSFCGYYRGRDVVISAQFNESTVWEASTVQHIDIYLPYILTIAPNLHSRRIKCYLLSTDGAFF